MSAQSFNGFSSSLDPSRGFIDPLLPTDESLGQLPVGNEKWDVRYYELIEQARLSGDGYRPEEHKESNNDRQRVGNYTLYESPAIYYGILGLPNNKGLFYGLFTTGYNTMEQVMEYPKKEWHPFTEVKPFLGTIVYADGTEEEYCIHSASEWEKASLKKPSGSYWRYIAPENAKAGIREIQFTFQPGGTGTITLVPPITYVSFISYTGGSTTKKMPNGRVKSKSNVIQGGDVSWEVSSKRAMKWVLDSDGSMTVTPTGRTTLNYKEWVKVDKDDNTYYISKADSITSLRQQEHDLKYVHDEVPPYRTMFKEKAQKLGDCLTPLDIQIAKITKNEILCKIGGKTVYMPAKRQTDMDNYPYFIYQQLDKRKEAADKKRTRGIDLKYKDFVNRVKLFVTRNHSYFGMDPSYLVTNINPVEETGEICYVLPNRVLSTDFKLDASGNINLEEVKEGARDVNLIPGKAEKIENLHKQILTYKKDKQRGKVVKKYEKDYKNFGTIQQTFNNAVEYSKILKRQDELIKMQEGVLEYLK